MLNVIGLLVQAHPAHELDIAYSRTLSVYERACMFVCGELVFEHVLERACACECVCVRARARVCVSWRKLVMNIFRAG